jgi:hypothetical protein
MLNCIYLSVCSLNTHSSISHYYHYLCIYDRIVSCTCRRIGNVFTIITSWKRCLVRPWSQLFSGGHALLMLFVSIYSIVQDYLHIRLCSCRLTVAWRMSLVERELTIPEPYSSTSVFSRVRVAQSLIFCIVFCRPLFVVFPFVNVLSVLPFVNVLSVLLRLTSSGYTSGMGGCGRYLSSCLGSLVWLLPDTVGLVDSSVFRSYSAWCGLIRRSVVRTRFDVY